MIINTIFLVDSFSHMLHTSENLDTELTSLKLWKEDPRKV